MNHIRENNPELAAQIAQLNPAMRAYSMLTEAKDIGLTVDASILDCETVHLVYLIKTKLREREEKKAAVKRGATRRGR